MVYSGGDGSIIGLISHIWRRNGSELLLDLIYGFEKFEEPPDSRNLLFSSKSRSYFGDLSKLQKYKVLQGRYRSLLQICLSRCNYSSTNLIHNHQPVLQVALCVTAILCKVGILAILGSQLAQGDHKVLRLPCSEEGWSELQLRYGEVEGGEGEGECATVVATRSWFCHQSTKCSMLGHGAVPPEHLVLGSPCPAGATRRHLAPAPTLQVVADRRRRKPRSMKYF